MNVKHLGAVAVFLIASCAFSVSLAAIAGFLAFALWPLDVFNHFQVIIFPTTFLLFVLCAIFAKKQPIRGLIFSICATGFVASSLVVLPEITGALSNRDKPALGDAPYRLMTFNIFAKNEDIEGLFASIKREDPDVLTIQEYWRFQRDELHDRLTELLPYSVQCQGGKRSFLGLYSKFPLETIQGHNCVDSISAQQRMSIIAVNVQTDTSFNVVTTHFDWPIPALRQREQMETLSATLSQIDGPLLVAGDFNSTPYSYGFKSIVKQTGLRRSAWLSPTWPAPPTRPIPMPPLLQLDHILTRGAVAYSTPHRAGNGGSDHFPLVMDFEITSASDANQ